MEKIEEELKDRIRRLRKEAGLSQVALANLSNLSVQSIKDIEAGRRGVGFKAMQSLASAFGLPMEAVAGETPVRAEKVVKFKIRKLTRYLESIPDDIYEMALKFGPDHEVWKTVKVVMEDAEKDLEKKSSSKARA